jgi:hypothetical protein
MATDSIVGGLFGMSPEQYDMALRQQEQAAGAKLAQLSPFERGQAAIYSGGAQLGRGLGGLMGVEDPQLKQITLVNQLASQFDTSTSGGVAGLAQALANRGLQAPAIQLGQRALEMRKLEAEAQSKTMERLTNEQKNAAGIADASGATRGTPEWTDTYRTELARLTAGSKGANIKEIGVAEGSREPVYFDVASDTQFVMKVDPVSGRQVRVPFSGGVDRTTAKTSLGVKLPEGESEFVKELGKLDAKRVNDALTLREQSISTIKSLNKLASLPSQDLISGSFATGRVGATNLLATLGLAAPSDINKLNTSGEYQKVAGDVILQTLGGKLGAGFSNEDRKFIQGLIPQLETSPEARRSLIKYMQEKNQDIVKETLRLEDYARDKKGLSGFKANIPISVTPTTGVSALSDEELAAQIRAAKQGRK